jgi:hypothetical protein
MLSNRTRHCISVTYCQRVSCQVYKRYADNFAKIAKISKLIGIAVLACFGLMRETLRLLC